MPNIVSESIYLSDEHRFPSSLSLVTNLLPASSPSTDLVSVLAIQFHIQKGLFTEKTAIRASSERLRRSVRKR